MSEVFYNLFQRKVDLLGERVSNLLDTESSSCPVADIGKSSELLSIVFAGQYSAGKSSLIKMLTNESNIKIGAGVTTDSVAEYRYSSLSVWDTPGILAGQCEKHDEKALEAIDRADLVAYVITNELFDDVVGSAFRNLCFDKGRAKELMIIINKFENDSASKETKIAGIAPVLEPKIPEDFPIVFTDAESYFDALDEEDEEDRKELIEASNRDGLVKEINSFVARKGIYSRLTTPLQEYQNKLQEKIDNLTIDDPLSRGVVSILTQYKRVFNNNKRDYQKKVRAALDEFDVRVIENGNSLADAIGSDSDEFERSQEKALHECEILTDSTLESIKDISLEAIADLETELEDLSASPAAIKVMDALKEARNLELKAGENKIDEFSRDDPLVLSNSLTKGLLTSAEKGFSVISRSAIGTSGRTGLGGVSGSQLHDIVKGVGKLFNYKFGPWEAVKIADKIGKGAKFLGPAMSVLGVGMQILDDYQRAEQEKKVLQVRRDIRKSFREYAKSTRDVFDEQVSVYVSSAFLTPVDEIDKSLEEIRMQAEKNSDSAKELSSLLAEVKLLRDEIQSAYE